MNNTVEKLEEYLSEIKHIPLAMLTTTSENGEMESFLMTTLGLEMDGKLYFFISKESRLAHKLAQDNRVSISFADNRHNIHFSAIGHASFEDLRHKAYYYWKPTFRAWYPKGLRDPNLAFVKIDVNHIHRWMAPSQNGATLEAAIMSVVTGEPINQISHDEITLNGYRQI